MNGPICFKRDKYIIERMGPYAPSGTEYIIESMGPSFRAWLNMNGPMCSERKTIYSWGGGPICSKRNKIYNFEYGPMCSERKTIYSWGGGPIRFEWNSIEMGPSFIAGGYYYRLTWAHPKYTVTCQNQFLARSVFQWLIYVTLLNENWEVGGSN